MSKDVATVAERTNKERGEEAERQVRERLGVVCRCPQHGASMKARSSTQRVTYYRCKYCTFSKKVTRPD